MGVSSTEPTLQTSRSVHKKLESYQNKLLHTDGRNHSILLRRIIDKWCFDLTVLNEKKRIIDYGLRHVIRFAIYKKHRKGSRR